jgi:hypothetical protein
VIEPIEAAGITPVIRPGPAASTRGLTLCEARHLVETSASLNSSAPSPRATASVANFPAGICAAAILIWLN